jgi:two-component system heavy metal sensor histidine kinase CusS
MSISSNTRSFRLRLVLQTMLVAGLLVASFGAAAWWYAGRVLERSVDDRITAPAQRVWSRIDPRTSDEEFKLIADLVFGTSPAQNATAVRARGERAPAAARLFLPRRTPPKILRNSSAPISHPGGDQARAAGRCPRTPAPRSTQAPPPPQRDPEFGEILGLPPEFAPRGPQGGPPQGRAPSFRPQMPMVREPGMFTASSGGIDWRFGAFSSPEYTLFIGLSLTDYYAELHRMARWFAGMGVLALALAGLGAWWTSKRAMRPLERVVTTAQRLTASDLAERIPLQRDDDREFAQLIDVLNGMMERLQGSFQQAVRFTADASHELKTPLAVMLATLDDAVRHATPGSAEHERFVSLFEEANRLKNITQSLLLLSQADAGRLPTNPATYDLSADLSRLIEDARNPLRAGRTRRWSIKSSPASPFMPTARSAPGLSEPPQQRHQIQPAAGTRHLHLALQDTQVVFTVTNTGPAIPAENQSRLFERFFRGDAAHNRQTDGFGLGLNIATELARANGAELRLVSSQEDETVFAVRMNAVKPN